MADHKFTVGDRVSLMPDRLNANVRPGVYTIVRTMPLAGQGISIGRRTCWTATSGCWTRRNCAAPKLRYSPLHAN